MIFLFRIFSWLPLWLVHGLGWALGWLVFLASGSYRRGFLAHAAQARVEPRDWRRAVGEAGKLVAELPRLWLGAPVPIRADGFEHVEHALTAGKGVIFLTPHLGCFEITAQAYAQTWGQSRQPMTVLYRPARQPWLRDLVAAVRHRPGLDTAPTNLGGVKQMLKALRQGQSLGLLPDQVPPEGMGLWVPFFGRDAYTMTLSARLARQSGATVLTAWGERLPWGRGFVVHVAPLAAPLPSDPAAAASAINTAMETLIQTCPSQYLWGYERYKQPRLEA
jgi:Kdo2-lipid IVA lauroyltransferase/acyltransferase